MKTRLMRTEARAGVRRRILPLLVICGTWLGWNAADAKSIRRVPAQFSNIQSAIDATNPGDEVLVSAGRYTGPGNKNLDLRQKDITIRSESGAEQTVIDCEGTGRGFVLYGAHTPAALIEGFTIENGNGNNEAVGGGGMVIGGGSPTIRKCVFRRNAATSSWAHGGGGGLVCHGSLSLIEDCTFIQNSVTQAPVAVGGGLASHESRPTIRRCRFIENVAVGSGGGGGGVYSHLIADEPAVVIMSCEFIRNEATSGGGGVVSDATIEDCRFENNLAEDVGGLAAIVDCRVSQSVFTGNAAMRYAGGVSVFGSLMIDCTIQDNSAAWGAGVVVHNASTIERCLISDNVAKEGAGGLLCNGRVASTITRCTIARNTGKEGSGLVFTQPLNAVTNLVESSIVSFNRGGNAISCFGFSTVVLSCTNLFGNEGGDWVGCVADQAGLRGNFSADPRFCGLGKDDFTLAANSPCLPGNHPQGEICGLIGAKEEGCPAVAVEVTTWGRIKARAWPAQGE